MNIQTVTELYIAFRDSLKYRDSSDKKSRIKHTIREFAQFVGVSKETGLITEEDCTSFLNRRNTTVTNAWKKDHCAIKKLFEWACLRGYTPINPIPKQLPVFPDAHPAYIYSNDELRRLFDASLTYMKAESLVTDPRCIRFILMTTYAMGLRIRETLAIRFKHIDRKQQIIHIEDSKFFKSRYVTYNHQVAKLINEIFEWRKSDSYSMEPDDYVFVSKLGKPVNLVTLHCIFSKIRKKANLYFPELKRFQPRIHDLRHSFATNVLKSWYKEGKDVQSLLPKLSIYLGHSNVSQTSVYPSMIPEILEKANELFYIYKNQDNENLANNKD